VWHAGAGRAQFTVLARSILIKNTSKLELFMEPTQSSSDGNFCSDVRLGHRVLKSRFSCFIRGGGIMEHHFGFVFLRDFGFIKFKN
jgi:hypothetical protein